MFEKSRGEHLDPEKMTSVSILLPNFNGRRFLEERLQSIFKQTFTAWELIVVDSYSDDGSWEILQHYAAQDHRIRLSQALREGIYAGINRGLEFAQGNYIYIAPADDTMTPDCLEKMVAGLEAHPECDLCHCCLKIIDEQGNEAQIWRDFPAAQFYKDVLDQRHIRLAPCDGLLHCGLYILYSSLTQLLIRRSVFQKIGLFRTDWGAMSDFEWGMRASLVCNTLHLPETLATWRRHAGQATQETAVNTARHRSALCEMIRAALPILKRYHPEYYRKIRIHRLLFPYRREQCFLGMQAQPTAYKKIRFLLDFLFLSPASVKAFLEYRFLGKSLYPDDITYIRNELQRLGLTRCVQVLHE